MTKKTMASIVLALVLGALPASADHRTSDRDRDRDRRSEHARHEAGDANVWKEEARIATLARRLDRATSELVSEAIARTHHRSWREFRAIHALRSLERRADVYRARVERDGAGSRHAALAYRELEQAYRVARDRSGDLRSARRLRGGLHQVGALMGQLDQRIARLDRLGDRRQHASRGGDDRYRSDRERSPWFAFGFGF